MGLTDEVFYPQSDYRSWPMTGGCASLAVAKFSGGTVSSILFTAVSVHAFKAPTVVVYANGLPWNPHAPDGGGNYLG